MAYNKFLQKYFKSSSTSFEDKAQRGIALKDLVSKAYGYAEVNRINQQVVSTVIEKGKKVVLITSPHDDSGNTFMVSVLGYSAAYLNNLNVLLVDVNMRLPQLHLPFGLGMEKGFTDIASGSIHWKEVVKQTSLPGLKVVTAGLPDERLPFFLNRPFLRVMIKEMCENFDMIIFDTSPLLIQNKNNVDPVRLSLLCDQVFIVIQDKITKKGKLKDSVAAVIEGGGKIDGVIFNRQF